VISIGDEILVKSAKHTSAFGKIFLPNHYTRPFNPAVHKDMFAVIDSSSQKNALAAPRGIGKTTTAGLTLPLRKICWKLLDYICIISCTATKACEDLGTLKKEIETNELLLKVFGDLAGNKWAEDVIETSNGVRVVAKGAGQQIRGTKSGHARPQLIIIDDLENPEAVRSPERRAQLEEWLFADVINSLADGGSIVLIGTVLHQAALLTKLLENPSWNSKRIELFNAEGKSNYPEYKSDAEIKKMIEEYRNMGMLDTLYREYRNLPISSEDAIFKPEYFKVYDPDWIKLPTVRYVVLVDPAKTVKMSSDFSAVICVGVDTTHNRIMFVDCISARMEPDEIYKHAADMADRWKTSDIGVEVTSLHLFITTPFKTFLSTRGKYYNLIELHARGKKEDRIKELNPFYKQGIMYHNPSPSISGKLEEQLSAFPCSRNDDVMDDFAYILEVFDIQNMVFSVTGLPDFSEEDEYTMLLEKEDYIPLPRYQLAP
jgi:phage terminase large subunit-like protein